MCGGLAGGAGRRAQAHLINAEKSVLLAGLRDRGDFAGWSHGMWESWKVSKLWKFPIEWW